MKRVLFISYHFPPSGGAKTRRTLKFLKYLPRLSWQTVVLTAKGGKLFNFDPSLLKEIPTSTQVHRIPIFPGGVQKPKPRMQKSGVKRSDDRLRPSRTQMKRFFKRWVAIPDEFIVWVPSAVFKATRLLASEPIDVVYSTAPPFSNHLAAAMISRLTRKPLVIDFRDAWVANPVRLSKYSSRMRQRLEASLERSVVRAAHRVISTTPGITADFRARYRREAFEKFITITNGYDKEDSLFIAPNHTKPHDKLCIVHTGYLRNERSPKPFLEALRMLIDERPALANKIDIHLIGEHHTFNDGFTLDDYIQRYKLSTIVQLSNHLPRNEATQYQHRADILLLIIGEVPPEQICAYGVASKVFDYMLAQKPVLAIAEPGPVSQLVESTKIGDVISPANIVGIKKYLSDALDKHGQGTLTSYLDKDEVARYDMQLLTKQLVDVFEFCSSDVHARRIGYAPN